MPSKFTRRHFLGGVAGGGALTLSGYQFLPAKFLPNVVLEERTKRQQIPEVETTLSVAPDAISQSRKQLRDVIDRGEAAWKQVEDADVESDQEEFDRNLQSTLDTAREKLSETEGNDATTETLKNLRYGVNRGAWSLAAAKAISEEYDLDAIRSRSEKLYSNLNEFAESMSHAVADPRRGLAYLYRSQRALTFARMKTDFLGDPTDEERANSELDHGTVVSAIRAEIEGRRWLGDAKAMYDAHRSNVADAESATDLESHLDQTWQEMAERIDGILPDRETAVERYFPESEGPHHHAVNELYNNGYMVAQDAYPPSDGIRQDLLAYVAVEHAKALQHALGFESTVKQLETAFENDKVGMPLVARTKTDAINRLGSLLDESNDPITRELAARPREEIVIGDWSLGLDPQFESEHPHAEAYSTFLLAAQNIRHTPDVLDSLLP
ncbi:hypothetical protein [Halorussus halophilus]|uniref:hypothetical protein n=1 Tax=Halorussus halophilus TaxID=2650975 RepID=UPI001300F3CE|nr:hypothetical protein [Halorussus halophilus]